MYKKKLLPNKIKQFRKKQDKTQDEVAKDLGTSRRGYQDIERGSREPAVTMGILLAQILECGVTDLYGKDALTVGEERRRLGNQARMKAKGQKPKKKKGR